MLACHASAQEKQNSIKNDEGKSRVQKSIKPKTLSIAVLTLEAQGVDAKLPVILTDIIIHELRHLPNTRVIGSKEIDTMQSYEQKKQFAGCSDTSCMIAISGALGVDKLVLGSIGRLGDSYLLNIKVIDILNAVIDATFSRRIDGGKEEDFLDIVPEALTALFPAGAGIWAVKQANETQQPVKKAIPVEKSVKKEKTINRKTAGGLDAVQWGHVSFWCGTGLAGFGGLSLYLAKVAADDYNSGKGGPDAKTRSEIWSAASITGFSLGGALMATGAVLWILDASGYWRIPDKKLTGFMIVPSNDAMLLTWSGTW